MLDFIVTLCPIYVYESKKKSPYKTKDEFNKQ